MQNEDMAKALIDSQGISIHVDDVYDQYWPSMLPKLYQRLGEKLAESLAAAGSDDPAPKRKASDSPTITKASKLHKSALGTENRGPS